jgi:membrane protein implicated in regulation of membrane protease activity
MVRIRRAFLSALLGVLLLSACATSVGRVTADPSRYLNRDVTISGVVVSSASVLGRGVYRVEDNTGSLWIVSTRGVPREGARVSVKGRIQDGFDIGMLGGVNLPAGLSSGVVLIESSHRIR